MVVVVVVVVGGGGGGWWWVVVVVVVTTVQPANSQTKSYLCVVTDLEEPLFQVPPLHLDP